MRTVTAKVLVQMSEYCSLTPDDFETMSGDQLAGRLHMHPERLAESYTIVGEATVTMTIPNSEQLIAAKVSALEDQLRKHDADAEVKRNKIKEHINSLLAITYKPEES